MKVDRLACMQARDRDRTLAARARVVVTVTAHISSMLRCQQPTRLADAATQTMSDRRSAIQADLDWVFGRAWEFSLPFGVYLFYGQRCGRV